MTSQRSIVVVLCALIIVGGLVFVGWQRPRTPQSATGRAVIASFYPLAEVARQVGGELVDVTTVVPSNSEPHEYEPTPQELVQVYNAALFIYNGSGLDPWAERIAPELQEKGVSIINMSDHVALLNADGHENQFDPHFWLDPVIMSEQAALVREALLTLDPTHAAEYRRYTDVYQAKLRELDAEYRAGLATCARRDIITSHAAFGYVAQRYNLSITTIAGLSPEEEPSARTLSEIATLARQKNIQYIFFETLVSPRLAETVAAEIGATTLVFNPLEGITDDEQAAGTDYLSVMRDNLRNLRLALDCR